MHFISQELEEYVELHSENEPAVLSQLNRETYQKVLQPRMLSGHFQGRVLSMLSKIIQPEVILEIGTFTGYATICLAEGLPASGRIHTIDIKEELVDLQRKYFDLTGNGSQYHQHLGQALEILPGLNEKFDLVFIDADKDNYLNYYEMIVPMMNPGGIILSDNVLWSGKVLEALDPKDKMTKILLDYNKRLQEDDRVETVLLPIRDGLTLTRIKKQ